MMTVRDLINELENFDEDMEVVIGMRQTYGSDFAMNIDGVDEHSVNAWYNDDFNAVVITEGGQIGTVDYEDLVY